MLCRIFPKDSSFTKLARIGFRLKPCCDLHGEAEQHFIWIEKEGSLKKIEAKIYRNPQNRSLKACH